MLLGGCNRYRFPVYPASYHEFAYVSDGANNTVTVLDLVYLRRDRVLQVGRDPSGMAVNPVRNEVYVANAGSDSITVIDAETNTVVHTIGVHRTPYSIAVAPDGKRAYVANSGSNTVSVIDLDQRREIGVAATGEAPGVVRVAPDNRSLVVSNRIAGSLSVYSINPKDDAHPLTFRDAFSGCPGATDVAIIPDSSKAFVTCSGGHSVMAVWLAADPDSWRGKQDASLQHDQLLTLLDVGKTPTHLVVKPDGGEVFSTNFDSDSISEISTWTNEVLGTYIVGNKPASAVISRDNSSLWVSDFGSESATMYSIDDGRAEASVHTGARPDALAFSTDEHLLLVTDAGSADVSVIRMQDKNGPTLFTLLPAGSQPNDIVIKQFNAHLPSH
ncbi:beta-propeller fold lactonase family protein [Granulicella sp. 5B5]|nr:beta-propeller fold lactonase family protein [Granulicella sp. 5B5]